MNLNKKIATKDITKDNLIKLYFIDGMTLDQIGHYFGYYDRQPIQRLFKKFDIETRKKSEISSLQYKKKTRNLYFPTKNDLEKDLEYLSILDITKKYKVSRERVNIWFKKYNLQSNYYLNKNIKDEIFDKKYDNMTPKELSIFFDVGISIIKYYRKTFPIKTYTKDEIFIKLEEYGCDLNKNQTIVSTIKNGDPGLFNSIIELTKDHNLFGNKFTEKLYRLKNNYKNDQIDLCKFCGERLKFYTFDLGYGNSDINICKNCIHKHCGFGVSQISQKLFDSVYKELNMTDSDVCYFSNLNREFILYISNNDIIELSNMGIDTTLLNRCKYHIDFKFNNKIIEFDGEYWHIDKEKEFAKDEFFKIKGYEVLHIKEKDYYENPQRTITKCLTFLNQQ